MDEIDGVGLKMEQLTMTMPKSEGLSSGWSKIGKCEAKKAKNWRMYETKKKRKSTEGGEGRERGEVL